MIYYSHCTQFEQSELEYVVTLSYYIVFESFL